jgi:hypothetical protein
VAPGHAGALTGTMTTSFDSASPVHLTAVAAAGQPTVTPALEELYRGFDLFRFSDSPVFEALKLNRASTEAGPE